MAMLEKLTLRTHKTIHRDSSWEHSAMQCAKVERDMRNAAHSFDLRKWLKCGFDNLGNPVLCNGQILMRPDVPFMSRPLNSWSFASDLQPTSSPQLTLNTLFGKVINNAPGLQAMFLLLRLSHINNIGDLNDTISGAFSQEDIAYGAFLGRARGIAGEWNATTAPDDGAWARVPLAGKMLPDSSAYVIPVYDIDGVLAYMLEIVILSYDSYAVLPVAYYQNSFYHVPLRLYIPPRPPYTLLNAHLLADYPNATVVLTDDIILALANKPSADMIYLANPGEDAWIDHLDLDPVAGRKVICAVFNTNNPDKKQQYYRTGVKMAEKLHAAGITPRFAIMQSEGGVC